MIDGMLLAERTAREERASTQLQQVPFLEVEVKEAKKMGEELEERKRSDILAQSSTGEFMKVLKPETDAESSKGQKEIEGQLLASVKYTRSF